MKGALQSAHWLNGSGSFDFTYLFYGLLPIWLLGTLTGMLLPRPRDWSVTRGTALLFSTPPGTPGFLRRLALLYHGFILIRELWVSFTQPGTFHAFCGAVWRRMKGEKFVLPAQLQRTLSARSSLGPVDQPHLSPSAGDSSWYVTEDDLTFFRDRIEKEVDVPGAGNWQKMCDKDFDHFQYTAWKRHLPGAKTEYKSITVAEDATAEEFMDFYLADPVRPTWDSMISHYEILENGSGADRCQVVRWERTFPFSFLNKREYIIGRKMWRRDGCLYCMTKAVTHPRAIQEGSTVRMDVFYSMWRSRTIPCPHGSDRPACETVLLHLEQFKIPENLARFAVRHGMATFVKKMGPAVHKFVAERRTRVGPFEVDPDAYGVNTIPNPPTLEGGSLAKFESEPGSPLAAAAPPAPRPNRRRKLLRFGGAALAVGGAILAGGRRR